MIREEIIQRVLLLDREQLLQLQQLLDQLEDRIENPPPASEQDQEGPVSG